MTRTSRPLRRKGGCDPLGSIARMPHIVSEDKPIGRGFAPQHPNPSVVNRSSEKAATLPTSLIDDLGPYHAIGRRPDIRVKLTGRVPASEDPQFGIVHRRCVSRSLHPLRASRFFGPNLSPFQSFISPNIARGAVDGAPPGPACGAGSARTCGRGTWC